MKVQVVQTVVGSEIRVAVYAAESVGSSLSIRTGFSYTAAQVSFAEVQFPSSSSSSMSGSTVGSEGRVTINASAVPPTSLASPLFTLVFKASGSGAFDLNFSSLVLNGTAASFTDPAILSFSVNGPPVATGAFKTGNEDIPIEGLLSAKDPEGDSLSFVVVESPKNGVVDVKPDGSYTYTPKANYSGSDSFSFTASDGVSTSNTAKVSLTLLPVNDAPALVVAIPDADATPGTPFSHRMPEGSFADVDSLFITYDASLADGSPLPSWLYFSPFSGSFTGTPGSSDAGNYEVVVKASDGLASVSDSFTLSVAQVLSGGAGIDAIKGSSKNDRADGGDGLDSFFIDATMASSKVSRNADGSLTVTGPGGKDVLQNIERIAFKDSAVAFDVNGIGGKAYRLYQAAYDRSPDATGLGFWMYHLDRGFDLTEAANNFLKQSEFEAIYGANPTNEQFVYLLYKHVHHREPDAGGLQFWIDAMYNKDGAFGKQWTKGEILLKFSESSENIANLIGVMESGFVYTPYDPGP